MSKQRHFEVIVVGAGVSGIYQIKRLVDLGVDTILLEGDDDLGGTWYRNRYPGARFDSESYTYGYSFSQELLDEWHWKERFSSQPENLRYLDFVARKFDLRRHMRFDSRVEAMTWHEAERIWQLDLQDGDTFTARFVITGIGVLSIPTPPRYEGMETYEGESFHTFWWPKEEVPLAGRRVGVIGTGATGIQVIAEIADKVGELFVFQRRPNWSTPLNNSPISEDEMTEIRGRYDEIFANCAASANGFEHVPDRRGFWKLTPEERRKTWDRLYDEPGFALLGGNFPEIFFEEAANREISEYVAERIRGRVHDPEVAEKLIPRDHGFGTQRLPLETHYFEAYNRANVHLVDLSETPIERFTPRGLETSGGEYELDVIVLATGFDAITGAFDHIDIRDRRCQGVIIGLHDGRHGEVVDIVDNSVELGGGATTADGVATEEPELVHTHGVGERTTIHPRGSVIRREHREIVAITQDPKERSVIARDHHRVHVDRRAVPRHPRRKRVGRRSVMVDVEP